MHEVGASKVDAITTLALTRQHMALDTPLAGNLQMNFRAALNNLAGPAGRAWSTTD